jgi:hypothetical protein
MLLRTMRARPNSSGIHRIRNDVLRNIISAFPSANYSESTTSATTAESFRSAEIRELLQQKPML